VCVCACERVRVRLCACMWQSEAAPTLHTSLYTAPRLRCCCRGVCVCVCVCACVQGCAQGAAPTTLPSELLLLRGCTWCFATVVLCSPGADKNAAPGGALHLCPLRARLNSGKASVRPSPRPRPCTAPHRSSLILLFVCGLLLFYMGRGLLAVHPEVLGGWPFTTLPPWAGPTTAPHKPPTASPSAPQRRCSWAWNSLNSHLQVVPQA